LTPTPIASSFTNQTQSKMAPILRKNSKQEDYWKRDYFKSRRVKPEDVQMPWLDEVCRRTQIKNAMVITGFVLGLATAGILIWHSMRSVGMYHYCEAYHDNFTTWNDSVWTKEVELGGFGYVAVVGHSIRKYLMTDYLFVATASLR